jgi:hypothetical protein
MKKIFLIIFLTIFLFLIVAPVYGGVVPCGLSQDDPAQEGDQTVTCQFCHIFVLFKNIVDFFLFKIVPPLAALMLAIGGFMYIFAHLGEGGPTMLSQANKLLMSVVWGLLIIFGAWIFVNTFFQIIGVATWDGWSLKESWWKINCL